MNTEPKKVRLISKQDYIDLMSFIVAVEFLIEEGNTQLALSELKRFRNNIADKVERG